MTLTKPDFRLDTKNPNPALITDAEHWLRLRLEELEPASQHGGTYANKPGFHNTGKANKPTNYSVRDKVNQSGPGWTHASAIDWTFPDAQRGDFKTIDKYTSRLWKSAHDANDPRLDLILFEFYGQADSDRAVEGYNEYREDAVTSDPSHLWHIHMSFLRSKCGDFWSMWALLTVLMGWSVAQWRGSLPSAPPPAPPKPNPTPAGLPKHADGSRENSRTKNNRGTDVATLQRFIGRVKVDGEFGPATEKRVKEYQRMRGLTADGIAGPRTWKPILAAIR